MTPVFPSSLLSFAGKTVLVTGSSRNLGYTLAAGFAEAGARVIVHGSHGTVEEARERLTELYPQAEVHAASFDLGDATAIERAFDELSEKGLMPDVLVNNAAHLGLGESGFLAQTPEHFRDILEVNLFGAFQCAQLVARHLKAIGGGAIINISSLAGERGIHGRSGYNVSKAALDGLTRSMAQELSGDSVRVNAVVLGYVWTERWNALSPEDTQRRLLNTPAGAPSSQEEIARLVMFLASEAAPTLVGARIVLDGGLNVQQVPRDVVV
jgi:3-oxoacyl-[acyl-carrier protein] reductase